MYICICNAIREKDLRAAARCCRDGAEELYARLGRTPQCRQCLDEADDIVAEERALACCPA
jgi:bacterioferritin-associated ferredoxin